MRAVAVKDRELIKLELEDILEQFSDSEFILFNLDVNHFKHFYNEYGPEQRAIVVREINDYLERLHTEGIICYHAKSNYGAFFCLIKEKEKEAMPEIKHEIEAMDFPVYNGNFGTVEIEIEGKKVGLKPNKITIRIGAVSLDSKSDVEKILSDVEAAKEKAKEVEDMIYMLP